MAYDAFEAVDVDGAGDEFFLFDRWGSVVVERDVVSFDFDGGFQVVFFLHGLVY